MNIIFKSRIALFLMIFLFSLAACAARKPIGTNPGQEQRKTANKDIGGQTIPRDKP